VDETGGNVHSGARPPWLETTTADNTTATAAAAIIGPTADDLKKHCMSALVRPVILLF